MTEHDERQDEEMEERAPATEATESPHTGEEPAPRRHPHEVEPVETIATARHVTHPHAAAVASLGADEAAGGVVGGERRGSARRFVAALLAATFLLMAAVGAVNAIVDPYGVLGTGIYKLPEGGDRDIKVALVNDLKQSPELIILGSSRARRVDPAYLQEKTGLRTFNMSVGGGRPSDSWAFVNLLHERFPQAGFRYLYLVDVESFTKLQLHPGLLNQPDLRRYFPSSELHSSRLQSSLWIFSWQTLRDSWSLVRADRTKAERALKAKRRQFRPDGYMLGGPQSERPLRQSKLDYSISEYEELYRTDYTRLDPGAQEYFEKTLALLDELGGEGVVVITPMHPDVIAAIGPLGWDRRHHEVVDYLTGLQPTYGFTLVDLATIDTFGGDPQGFNDGVHMKPDNLTKMIDTVLARSDQLDGSGPPP